MGDREEVLPARLSLVLFINTGLINFKLLNLINLNCAISIMLGANIGTTLTGYLATINTSNNTKVIVNRNLLFNVLGVLLFILFFNIFINHISNLETKYFSNNLKFSIAYAHFIFNLITVILGYIFFNLFTYKIETKKM